MHNKSPTIFNAEILADGVRGVLPLLVDGRPVNINDTQIPNIFTLFTNNIHNTLKGREK